MTAPAAKTATKRPNKPLRMFRARYKHDTFDCLARNEDEVHTHLAEVIENYQPRLTRIIANEV